MRGTRPRSEQVKRLALAAFLLNLTSTGFADDLADSSSPALTARSESIAGARPPQNLINRSEPKTAADLAQRTAVHTSLAKLPLAFEQNQGQTDARVKFQPVAPTTRCS